MLLLAQFEVKKMLFNPRGIIALVAFSLVWLLILLYPIRGASEFLISPDYKALIEGLFGPEVVSELFKWSVAELAIYWIAALYLFPLFSIFIAADRAKEIHSATLKVFEKYLGSTKTSLAVKKARLVFCQLDSLLINKQVHQSPFPTVWSLAHQSTNDSPSREFTISNHANVYAREKLDIGARYFIENLPHVAANAKVIDLGCGNGVIGLSVLANQPQAHVQFIDESVMAIASAQQNIQTNMPELINQCEFTLNDSLTDIEGGSVDLILCNPPFHQNTATTDHIAWQMFKDSHRVLKKGGELRIIGNQKLAYHIKLQRLFGNETLIASNNKFVTQSAIKR